MGYDVMKEKLDMLDLDLITKELGLVVYGRKVGLQRNLNDLWWVQNYGLMGQNQQTNRSLFDQRWELLRRLLPKAGSVNRFHGEVPEMPRHCLELGSFFLASLGYLCRKQLCALDGNGGPKDWASKGKGKSQGPEDVDGAEQVRRVLPEAAILGVQSRLMESEWNVPMWHPHDLDQQEAVALVPRDIIPSMLQRVGWTTHPSASGRLNRSMGSARTGSHDKKH